MIVDDESMLAANIAARIQRCGGETFIASNGREAIALKPRIAPDVIVLDYHLPDMDGFDVLDAIRANDPDCPCLLMTGHPTEALLADARRHGVGRILCKPFSLAELESVLISTVGPKHRELVKEERRLIERRAEGNTFTAGQMPDGNWLASDRRCNDRRV
jgi:DNA-binding response OmpR family regulator